MPPQAVPPLFLPPLGTMLEVVGVIPTADGSVLMLRWPGGEGEVDFTLIVMVDSIHTREVRG